MSNNAELVEEAVGLFKFEANRKKAAEEIGLRESSITYKAYESHSSLNVIEKKEYQKLANYLNFMTDNAGISRSTTEIILIGCLENLLDAKDKQGYITALREITSNSNFNVAFSRLSEHSNDQYDMAKVIVKKSRELSYEPNRIAAYFKALREIASASYIYEQRAKLKKQGLSDSAAETKLREKILADKNFGNELRDLMEAFGTDAGSESKNESEGVKENSHPYIRDLSELVERTDQELKELGSELNALIPR